jgi:VanZ family protein
MSFVAFRYWKPFTLSVFILVLCLFPAAEFEKLHIEFNYTDLIVHFIMFFTFAAALGLDLSKTIREPRQKLSYRWVTLIISLVFAILTETLQLLLIFLNRTGSLTDLLFDLIGILSAIGVVAVIRRKPVAGL